MADNDGINSTDIFNFAFIVEINWVAYIETKEKLWALMIGKFFPYLFETGIVFFEYNR